MATGNITTDSDMIQQFINITGTEETVAKNMLEAFNNNLEMAINMFLEGHNPDQQEVHEIPPEVYSTDSADSSDRQKHKKERNIKDEHNGVIIDDEDEEDEVRAPIPQKQEVLVEDQYHAIPYQARPRRVAHSVFNDCRDFQKETEEYENELKNKWSNKRKRKRLHELFQPPVDLIHLGDFQSARNVCNKKKKWLLVNIQNSMEFACQVVNRDVWSNQTVRDIVNANFIMWQVSHDSDEGLHYATFYNVKRYPHISVIDPRTGERMVVWENLGMKPSADQFAELATLFLAEYPNLNDSLDSKDGDSEKSEKSKRKKSVIDLGEQDQLEAAISASMACSSDYTKLEYDSDSIEVENDDDEDEDKDDKEDSKNKIKTDSSDNKNNDTSVTNIENSIKSDSSTDKKNNTEENDMISKVIENDIMSREGEKATILLRLPDNGRKQILFPLECTLKELSLELSRLGWPDTRYEIIKAFPRQNISQLDQSLTLKDAGLHKQETLFVQDR